MKQILDFWKPDGVVANLDCDSHDFGSIPVIIMSTPPKGYRGKVFFIVHDSARRNKSPDPSAQRVPLIETFSMPFT